MFCLTKKNLLMILQHFRSSDCCALRPSPLGCIRIPIVRRSSIAPQLGATHVCKHVYLHLERHLVDRMDRMGRRKIGKSFRFNGDRLIIMFAKPDDTGAHDLLRCALSHTPILVHRHAHKNGVHRCTASVQSFGKKK